MIMCLFGSTNRGRFVPNPHTWRSFLGCGPVEMKDEAWAKEISLNAFQVDEFKKLPISRPSPKPLLPFGFPWHAPQAKLADRKQVKSLILLCFLFSLMTSEKMRFQLWHHWTTVDMAVSWAQKLMQLMQSMVVGCCQRCPRVASNISSRSSRCASDFFGPLRKLTSTSHTHGVCLQRLLLQKQKSTPGCSP